jgi:hypothetical protein
MKHGHSEQLTVSRDIESGHATPTIQGRVVSHIFAQANAQFFLADVSSKKTKFLHVISQLDHWYAVEVEDIITSPPERDPTPH